MGSCGYEATRPQPTKPQHFAGRAVRREAIMAYPRCDRFGEIQILRTNKDSIYHLIMAARLGVNTVKMETVSIECRVMNSLAEFELYESANFELVRTLCPIYDPYDKQNSQMLFHINSCKKQSQVAKIIKFDSFRDVKLKQGLYEISIHLSLDHPQLLDYFIMSRRTLNVLVMIYKYFQCSLLDIVQYRKEAGEYGWTENEVLFIWLKIVQNYRQLRQNNIYHRDIRLSNIYFTPANSTDPIQFVNLAAARHVNSEELKEPDRELMTVRGVNIFAESLKGAIEAGQELADYDPGQHDLACLERVLLSILNLDPLQQSRQCDNQLFTRLLHQIRGLKSLSELTQVQKTIQDVLRSRAVNTQDMLALDKQISSELSKKLLFNYYREQNQKFYLKNLILLHKRDLFNEQLQKKMEENEAGDRKELNLELLHQIGQYYESIGIENNDYYKEEISLVLDLAKQFRLEHFLQDQEQYIEKAMALIEKYYHSIQPLKLGDHQYHQRSYRQLQIRLKQEVVYSCLEAANYNEANQQLVELLNLAHKETALDLVMQTEVILTKAMVETTAFNWEAAESSLEKAGMIIGQSRNFVTELEYKQLRSELLMLEGYHYLRYIKEQKDDGPKNKYIGLAEANVTNVLQLLVNLPENPTNTVRIVDAYMLQAGLEIEKERLIEARKSLDAANVLLQHLVKNNHNVSSQLRRMVYEKLKLVTNPTDHSYPTVCRILTQLNAAEPPDRDSHPRIISQLAQSRRQQKQLRLLEKTVILENERE